MKIKNSKTYDTGNKTVQLTMKNVHLTMYK